MKIDPLKRLQEIQESGQKPDVSELLQLSRSLQRQTAASQAIAAIGRRLRRLMASEQN